ncbi:MAG: hypothetical protein IKR69_05230 [Bacteroidales bacterium]|nr:hypothetical protein [Bacteroidales bacterium]
MKKTLVFAVMAAAALSCSKEMPKPSVSLESSVPASEPAQLTVSINSPTSKATTIDTENESKVSTLDVFVFKSDVSGMILDAYGSSTSSSITLSATTGSRRIWAIVNADSGLGLSAVTTEAELIAKVSSLANNTLSKFVMTGNTTSNLSSVNSVMVDVNRIAARVKVKKVTFALPEAFNGKTQSVVRVYLTNVAGNLTFGGSVPASPQWFATTTLLESGGQRDLILNTWNATNGATLYCYPNSNASTKTKVVTEVMIDTKKYTYPIEIPSIAANTSYEINELVITRPGNPSNGNNTIDDGENDTITVKDVNFSISVKDWNLILLGSDGTVTI